MSFRAKAEAEAVKHQALERLAIARREKLAKVDYDVYLDGLEHYDAETVRRVCLSLATEIPAEFEPRFPTLAFIAERCRQWLHRKWEHEEEVRRAQIARLHDGQRPVDPELFANFKADVQREIQRKKMR